MIKFLVFHLLFVLISYPRLSIKQKEGEDINYR